MTRLRIAMFFLAAAIWIGGVILDDERVTGIAIVIAAAALVIGWVTRARRRLAERSLEVEPDEGVDGL